MVCSKLVCYFFILSAIVTYHITVSYPSLQIMNRHRRVSDQKLAELEALIGLSKLKGKIIKVPIGFGRVDPEKLGRRRRSDEDLFDKLGYEEMSSLEEEPFGQNEYRIYPSFLLPE